MLDTTSDYYNALEQAARVVYGAIGTADIAVVGMMFFSV